MCKYKNMFSIIKMQITDFQIWRVILIQHASFLYPSRISFNMSHIRRICSECIYVIRTQFTPYYKYSYQTDNIRLSCSVPGRDKKSFETSCLKFKIVISERMNIIIQRFQAISLKYTKHNDLPNLWLNIFIDVV